MKIPNFTIGDANRDAFCLLIQALPKGQLYTAKVTEKKSKRSLEANALYWEFIDQLRHYIKEQQDMYFEKQEMHQMLANRFLSYEKNNQVFIKTTSTMDTKEFSEYFERCQVWAAEMGFILEGICEY